MIGRILDFFGLAWVKAALVAAVLAAAAGGFAWFVHSEREIGAANTQRLRDEDKAAWQAAALAEAQNNAKETFRRIAAQEENQRVQNIQLAAARADASRNAAERDRLRDQNVATARLWRDALDHAPSVEQCQAAGAAIVLQTDVLGRADRRAGELAEYADAARIAGLKCQADYEALTK